MKSDLLGLLQAGDFDSIRLLAAKHKQILSLLTAQTYHPDPLIVWRAIKGLGVAARTVSQFDPEYVRVHLRRLFWLVNDESGGIGWRAPEAIGEILAQCPGQFEEFISPLVHLLEMEPKDARRFQAGILWGIGRAAVGRAEIIHPVLGLILNCLSDPEPQLRGMALWCLSQSRFNGSIPALERLRSDHHPVSLYLDDKIVILTVADLAKKF